MSSLFHLPLLICVRDGRFLNSLPIPLGGNHPCGDAVRHPPDGFDCQFCDEACCCYWCQGEYCGYYYYYYYYYYYLMVYACY